MTATARLYDLGGAALTRFERLSALDAESRKLIQGASDAARMIAPHRELIGEGKPVAELLLVLGGWAARVRYLQDGRRQIISFVLPGDLLGLCDQDDPVMSSTIVALTPVTVCRAPRRGSSPAIDRCYALSRAIDEANLLAQITRLGRLMAYERILDLVLELNERLALAGLADRGRFALPLTQEMLGDALGLTAVHVNRMVQQARRCGDLSWSGREIVLHDVERLELTVGRQPVRVSERR